MSRTHLKLLSAAGLLALIAMIPIIMPPGLLRKSEQAGEPLSGDGLGTETPPDPSSYMQEMAPLYYDIEAISESLKLFPPQHNPHDIVARLVPYATVDAWRGSSSFDVSPDGPAWVIGISGDNLSAADVMNAHAPGGLDSSASQRHVDGAFYVWDARSGLLSTVGVLHDSGTRSRASLSALESVSMTIVPADDAVIPVWPTVTPVTPGVPPPPDPPLGR